MMIIIKCFNTVKKLRIETKHYITLSPCSDELVVDFINIYLD